MNSWQELPEIGYTMNPALLGTDLNLPMNNLTTLASDYNWVEEMALLTRQGLPAALNMAMEDRMACGVGLLVLDGNRDCKSAENKYL